MPRHEHGKHLGVEECVENLKSNAMSGCQSKNWVKNHADQPVLTPLARARPLGRF